MFLPKPTQLGTFPLKPLYSAPFTRRGAVRKLTGLQIGLQNQRDTLNHDYHQHIVRQNIINEIQKNPGVLTNGSGTLKSLLLPWRTILLLIASSSSLTMALYLGVQVYGVAKDENAEHRKVFLPLWLSFDWPSTRRYAFPDYLKYVDPEYFAQVETIGNFREWLHEENIQYQILDVLFRLPLIRDRFGVPFSLKATEDDNFNMWVEPKYPTVHGPQIDISKEEGTLRFNWRWFIKLIRFGSSVDNVLTGLAVKLDRMDSALQKTHERGSGRVHEVPITTERKNRKVHCGDRDYKVMFMGSFHLHVASKSHNGVVKYTGVIDFDHLGINRGARIVLLDVESNGVNYKVS